MERVDIVVTGLDPSRPRAEAISALAERLGRTAADITLLLEIAPSPLVRAVSTEEAGRLLDELRALGALVKQRKEVPETTLAPVITETKAEKDPELFPIPSRHDHDGEEKIEEEPEATAPKPIVVHDASEWFGGASTAPPMPSGPAAPPLAEGVAAPTPARFGRAETAAPSALRPPRVFFAAIPSALAMTVHPPLLRALALAAVLGALALGLAAAGLRFDLDLGPLLVTFAALAASGFTGLVLQITAACQSATATGERAPAALPGRLMEDYLWPGGTVFVALGVLALLVDAVTVELTARYATRLTFGLFWGAVAIYGALGFVLSAANGSVFGFFDLARASRLFSRAPERGVTVVTLTSIALGGAGLGLARLMVVASASSLGASTFYVAVLGPIAALAVGLAAAASGALMGQLVYAGR